MSKDEGNLDKDLIRELAALLEETGLTEIEIEIEGRRIRVARGVNLTTTLTTSANGGPPIEPREHREPKRGSQADEVAVHPGTVTSPMVGTAYRSPEPGARTFPRSRAGARPRSPRWATTTGGPPRCSPS